MKYILSALFLNCFLFNSALATDGPSTDEALKSCHISLDNDELGKVDQTLRFYKNGSEYITKIIDHLSQSDEEILVDAFVYEKSVRENIVEIGNNDIMSLNEGEQLIYHAYEVTNDPEIGSIFPLNFDLTKVRFTKIYQVGGNFDETGAVAVVDAFDKDNNLLGSFFGGFYVLECK